MKRKKNFSSYEYIVDYNSIDDYIFEPNKEVMVNWDAETIDAIDENKKLVKRFWKTKRVTVLDLDGNVLYEGEAPLHISGIKECVDWETRQLKRKVRKYGHKNEKPCVEYKYVPRQYKVISHKDFDIDVTLKDKSMFW